MVEVASSGLRKFQNIFFLPCSAQAVDSIRIIRNAYGVVIFLLKPYSEFFFFSNIMPTHALIVYKVQLVRIESTGELTLSLPDNKKVIRRNLFANVFELPFPPFLKEVIYCPIKCHFFPLHRKEASGRSTRVRPGRPTRVSESDPLPFPTKSNRMEKDFRSRVSVTSVGTGF